MIGMIWMLSAGEKNRDIIHIYSNGVVVVAFEDLYIIVDDENGLGFAELSNYWTLRNQKWLKRRKGLRK